MYLSYTEYVGFGGTLDEYIFTELEIEAETLIDYATFNRLHDETSYSNRVKYLMNKLVSLLSLEHSAKTLGHSDGDEDVNITSQSNDGVSIAYNGMKAVDVVTTCQKEEQVAIKQYLAGEMTTSGKLLLYRGLYEGE